MDLMAIWILASQAFWSFTAIFIACECAERLKTSFGTINDEIDAIVWYKYPLCVRRMIPILMAGAQQPVELCVIASISCNRLTFKNVRQIKSYK